MTEDQHPLYWPTGVPRTPTNERQRAKFHREAERTVGESRFHSKEALTTTMALERLRAELSRFGVELDRVIVSSNLAPGLSLSRQREPEDPGVAVYFTLDGERRCVPSDKWDRVADNIAGIAAAIGALRGLARWVNDANVRAAFRGFMALPDPNRVDWRAEFGVKNGAAVTTAWIQERYRTLARERHPDTGGSDAAMAQLNRARTAALADLGEHA